MILSAFKCLFVVSRRQEWVKYGDSELGRRMFVLLGAIKLNLRQPCSDRALPWNESLWVFCGLGVLNIKLLNHPC